ncbi:MAG TPA: peptidoglycan DD-metalloendopeptidase family protein [Caldilineae bacterium]|nr:peptidoglycan DD-metalloendopeptidase family protein [Caldilineae bacterium]
MLEVSPEQVEGDVSDANDTITDDTWGPGHQLWLNIRRNLVGQGPDKFTPVRLASHVALLLVAVGLLAFTQIELPKWEIAGQEVLPAPAASPTPASLRQLVVARGGSAFQAGGPLTRSAVPFTIIPERPRLEVLTYAVQPGDTVFGIAEKFGIKPETIMWSNRKLELNPDMLRVNDQLIILPINGVYHEVKAGDTLAKVAKKYKAQVADIVAYELNNLESAEQPLQTGSFLIIPGGKKPPVVRRVSIYNGPIPKGARKGTGSFVWPSSGRITQAFWTGHRAIDIGSWTGNPVVASDSGYVVYAGWNRTGYGNLIIIDHGNGFRTYYAHLSRIFVRQGESIGQGQRIGSVGNTGNSTGPHLHFEIRQNGVLRNPIGYLR